jgi:gas vesicle protein
LVLGAVVGFVGGMLLAPSSGEETRDKLMKVTQDNEDLIRDTKEKTEDMVSKTLDAIDVGFSKLTKMVDKKDAA